jgi:hypothetical protein
LGGDKMKVSKTAKFHNVLGLIIFVTSSILFFINQKIELVLIGLCGLNLLWIMGIQHDLYENKKEIKNE